MKDMIQNLKRKKRLTEKDLENIQKMLRDLEDLKESAMFDVYTDRREKYRIRLLGEATMDPDEFLYGETSVPDCKKDFPKLKEFLQNKLLEMEKEAFFREMELMYNLRIEVDVVVDNEVLGTLEVV